MSHLSKNEAKLIAERLDFYVALDSGERTPTTDLQRQFVDVCKGIKKAQRDDEIAYAKYKELLEKPIGTERYFKPPSCQTKNNNPGLVNSDAKIQFSNKGVKVHWKFATPPSPPVIKGTPSKPPAIKTAPSNKRVRRVNANAHKPSLPKKPHSKNKLKPIAKHIGSLEEFNMAHFPHPSNSFGYDGYSSSRPRSGQIKEAKWKNSVSQSSGSSKSHIKSWMKSKGSKTIDRLNEFNRGSVPSDNWATREDIRKDSKANWGDSKKNKFF